MSMAARGWRRPGIGVPLLATLAVVGLADEALAGRSRHLDYAEGRGVELSTPDPGRALVVFLRPQSAGGSVHASVYDGEEFLSFVQKKTCFLYDAEPGEHRFMVVSESADFLRADLEGGRIYFVQVKPRMGAMRARFSLVPVTKSTDAWRKLPGWLEQAYLVKPNQSALAWVEANRPSVTHKMTVNLEKWKAKPPEDRRSLSPDDGVTEL